MPGSTAEKLVAAAEAELIAHDGKLEMAGVARRAGVSVGLAYHHFGSKTGLIVAVVERFYEPLREVMLGPAGTDAASWSKLERERFSRMVDHYYDHPLAPLLVGRMAREPEVIDIEREHLDALLAEGARNLRAAQSRGFLAAELDPEVAIGVIIGGVQEALSRALHHDPRPERAEFMSGLWFLMERLLRS